MQRPLFLAAASLTLAGTCCAQFQASNATARRLGLQVSEMYAAANPFAATAVDVDGPPNAAFALMLDVPGFSDRAYAYAVPSIAGPFCLDFASPTMVTINGTLSATGTASLSFGPSPIANGIPFHWQVAVADPLSPSGWAISNGVRRTTTALSPTTVPVLGAPAGSFGPALDVEQGDVDGDGDVDTLLLTCGGMVLMFDVIADQLQSPPMVLAQNVAFTSIELADFDNDNWYDLVASSVSPANNGAQIFYNLGRGGGTGQLPAWLGMSGPVSLPAPQVPGIPTALDVETADVDGDGYLDLVLACAGNAAIGVENRLFLNGVVAGAGFVEVTRPNLNPVAVLDDTEDVEFFDLDGDDDYDIVFANYQGPAAIQGVDWVYVNQGGLQGGVQGVFVQQPITGVNDRTIDVMVRDLDGDGVGDVYACNWLEDPQSNQTPRSDRLYLGSLAGPVLTFTDVSTLLPDNAGYTGPTPLPPFGSCDAEFIDLDQNPGSVEVLVSAGGRCNGLVLPQLNGMRLLIAFRTGPGLTPFFDFTANLPTAIQNDHLNDIEVGDWSGITANRDFGLASADPFLPGLLWLRR